VAASAGLVTTAAVQWFVFTILSVVSLLLFRGKIQARVEPVSRPPVDSLIGETAFPTVVLAPGAVGRVTLRGSTWDARNDGPTALEPNQRCRVTRVSGLQVGVVAE
jgi:membrane protein implicated in regulation of membrane protease activity